MEENQENKTPKKKYSALQIVSVVLIALLVVAIIVQIGIIVNLKNKTDDLQNKIDKLPSAPVAEQQFDGWNLR